MIVPNWFNRLRRAGSLLTSYFAVTAPRRRLRSRSRQLEVLESRALLDARPNIVLILTDDQRLDTMAYMPITQQELGDSGTIFTNAYTTNTLCCPARASILTGQYVHRHGVIDNEAPEGGFETFDDSATLATALQTAGYRTGLYGKYMNGYTELSPKNQNPNQLYTPPGWNEWHAFLGSSFFNFDMAENGLTTNYTGGSNYSTDVLADQAETFIRNNEANDEQPFFLYFSTKAPHTPANPAPRHNGSLDGLAPYRPPSFNEADVSDKPNWVKNRPLLTSAQIATIDAFRQNQLESLLAVDEAVGQLADTLRDTGELDNTVVIYMSDSGIQWGEHRYDVKGSSYEESIRIPLIVRDGRDPVARTTDSFGLNIDLAPTIAEYAGATLIDPVDGASFTSLVAGQTVPWRNDFLVEHLHQGGGGGNPPKHFTLRSGTWSYVEYLNGNRELYDLATDPYQLQSLHADPGQATRISQFSARLAQLKPQDTQAPQISNLQFTPNPAAAGPITILATLSDAATGGSEVRMPEYFIDTLGGIGKGVPLYAADNLFNSVTEQVVGTISSTTFNSLSEGSHTIYVRGRDVAGNWSAATTATLVKNTQGPGPSNLAIAPVSANKAEGNAGTTSFTFTVTRSGNTSGTTTVDYAVTGSGAAPANAADFGGALPSGTVSFAVGQTSQPITINVSGDTTSEANENFTVTLSNPSAGAQITTGTASGTIQNDDGTPAGQGLFGEYFNAIGLTGLAGTRVDPVVNFPQDWGSAPPGTPVTPDDNFSARWTGFVSVAATGNWTFYTTSNDGVRLWVDNLLVVDNWTKHNIVQNSAVVSLTAGWHPIKLEYFQQGGVAEITLSYQGPGQSKVIIPQTNLNPTDPSPGGTSLAIAAASANLPEGNAGATPFTFTVIRSGDTSGATTVNYAVTGSGAAPADAADFGGVLPSGTVSFAVGETSQPITIQVSGDTSSEPIENFAVTLSNPSGGAQINTASATGTIQNDDVPPPGEGLLGEYFNGINLTGPAGTRIDPVVNFPQDWGSAPPGTTVTPDDNFSARWTGFVQASAAGNWTFYTTSNDGVRLWINNVLVIDNWTQHAVTQNSATVSLAAGWHAIRLEYFQQAGVAEITLSFQGPGQAKTIIPQSNLRTSNPDALSASLAFGAPVVDASNAPSTLRASNAPRPHRKAPANLAMVEPVQQDGPGSVTPATKRSIGALRQPRAVRPVDRDAEMRLYELSVDQLLAESDEF